MTVDTTMIKINDNFTRLPQTYLFTEIARRVSSFIKSHPDADIIRMGIGDVTRPLCDSAIRALHKAVDDEGNKETFHGYGPEQGYEFLRNEISEKDYLRRGIEISPDEIFISDGAKSDTGNIGDILSNESKIAVTDPVYPVYVDTNVMAGRAGTLGQDGRWSSIIYLPCVSENNFVPELPKETPDVIYLCFPNNPTGTSLTRTELQVWVDYALKHNALILFDAAYEAYVSRDDVPRSIYELEGAKSCAIEFRSFSKTAGFTGVRCGYTVVPDELYGTSTDGERVKLKTLWNRRQTTKFNGASYLSQRAAQAIYTEEGATQIADTIKYYKTNAAILVDGLKAVGLEPYGGVDSPYIWVKTPPGMGSWEMFDLLLSRYNIVATPGSGFGPSGEGYLRLTAFNTHEATLEAMSRLKNM